MNRERGKGELRTRVWEKVSKEEAHNEGCLYWQLLLCCPRVKLVFFHKRELDKGYRNEML